MQLIFESVEEVRNFVKNELKGARRGGRDDGADDTPNPIMPNTQTAGFGVQGGGQPAGFPGPGAQQAQPAGPGAAAFPAAAAPANTGIPPEALALTSRILGKAEEALKGGQPAESILNWFRTECAKIEPTAANATMDQIKTHFLPRMPMNVLQGFAQVMGA
jgi:hypothetical protein